MRVTLVCQIWNVDCREDLQGLDVRGEIDALESDECVLFSIYIERDWFCFEIVSIELLGFRRIDHFFDPQLFFYDRDDRDRFYLERRAL